MEEPLLTPVEVTHACAAYLEKLLRFKRQMYTEVPRPRWAFWRPRVTLVPRDNPAGASELPTAGRIRIQKPPRFSQE